MSQPPAFPYPAPQHPQPAMRPPNRGRRIVKGCLLAAGIFGLVVVVVGALVINSLLPPGIGDHKRLTFHPQAPAAAWLHPGYAHGATLVELGAEIVAISDDQTIAVVQAGDFAVPELKGIALATQTEVWSQPVTHLPNPEVTDRLYGFAMDVAASADVSVVEIDPLTGEMSTLWADTGLIDLEFVGRHDTNLIVWLGDSLVSIAPSGTMNWQLTELPQSHPDCYVIGDVIGCAGYEEYRTFDAVTGAALMPTGSLDLDELHTVYWASDGFSVGSATTISKGYDFVLYDFQGNQLDQTVNATPPLVPGTTDRAVSGPRTYYPIADLADGDRVQAVDQSGKVIVSTTRLRGLARFQASGTEVEGSVVGISAAAEVIAMRGFTDGASGFYNAEGELLHEMPVSALTSGVMGGLIVFETSLLVPTA